MGRALTRAEDAAFQVMLCIVAAVHFSALFFFFFQGSFCQENISKQEWLSKCTSRFKLQAFKNEINQTVNTLSCTPRA